MKKVYLDNSASSPLLPEVREVMGPFMDHVFGNPSSLHDWGDPVREAIEDARIHVAQLIEADPEEIIFTSGGTESNNMAIKGLTLAQRKKGNHLVVSGIEHFSVLHAARTMEKLGFQLTFVPVDKHGRVNPDEVRKAIRDDTVLVSVMHANSEVGSIEPIQEIAIITREKGVVFHTDAVATAGTLPVNVKELGVDALSMSANLFYGPKGVGALWIRKKVTILPLLDGGIQEGGRRAGTENVPAIVGMGKAAQLARASMTSRIQHLSRLRDNLLSKLPARIDHVIVTGHPENRIPGHASFCVEFIEGESMLMMLNSRGIAVASGSACSSKALKASHVLMAMGTPTALAQGSVVFTFGLDNTLDDVDYVLESMPPIVEKLRQMSPLYSKFIKFGKEGI